jgi:hypothetical protein
MFNKMNEQARQSMMGGGGDGVLGTLGMENLDSGNALRLQWICEFITEEQFNRQLGDVQQALTVWVAQTHVAFTSVIPLQCLILDLLGCPTGRGFCCCLDRRLLTKLDFGHHPDN